jgi:hypothetical protein
MSIGARVTRYPGWGCERVTERKGTLTRYRAAKLQIADRLGEPVRIRVMLVEVARVVAKPQGYGDQIDIFIGCVQVLAPAQGKA